VTGPLKRKIMTNGPNQSFHLDRSTILYFSCPNIYMDLYIHTNVASYGAGKVLTSIFMYINIILFFTSRFRPRFAGYVELMAIDRGIRKLCFGQV